MAKFYPPLNVVKNFKVPPTEGEWKLLEFLGATYDDEYEVFFQPYLNEARPDVIVMRKGGGVLIVEVKDWNLSNYKSTGTGTWIVRGNDERMVDTPIRQVFSYKEKLYSLNSLELFSRRGFKENWGLVTCVVFFHKSTEAQVRALCYPTDITPKNKRFLDYFELLGDDSLTKCCFDKLLRKHWISRQSIHFAEAIYDELFRLFRPDFHTVEQGVRYELSHAQKVLAVSVAGARKRIKGVAGSGKSFVLARRAVSAHKRTGGNVLSLTYNITLKNYLKDRLSEVRENFDWNYFHIENYHQHFEAMLAMCNLSVLDVARRKWPEQFGADETPEGVPLHPLLSQPQLEAIYADGSVFEGHEDELLRYDVILIDEAQDWREEWVRIIMKYGASENAEIVAFADEKQNVYERKIDAEKFPVIPIATGAWDKSLNRTYRLNTKIAELSAVYQNWFFKNKYVIDGVIAPAKQLELIFGHSHVEYHLLPAKAKKKVSLRSLSDYLVTIMRSYGLHRNDMTVLSTGLDLVRELSGMYGEITGERVNCMCETQDEFRKYAGDERELKACRKFKKQNFRQNTGCVSFSSIHSFKGLESPATLLIIGDGELEEENGTNIKLMKALPELVYVGLTRARNNLFVVNFGDHQYDEFFRSESVRRLGDGVTMAISGELTGPTIME